MKQYMIKLQAAPVYNVVHRSKFESPVVVTSHVTWK